MPLRPAVHHVITGVGQRVPHQLREADTASVVVSLHGDLHRPTGRGGGEPNYMYDHDLLQGISVQDQPLIIGGGLSPSEILLHPGVLVASDRGQLLVDVLEGVAQAAGVDLAVGQAELLAGFLVLRLGEVAGHDPTGIVVGHFTL